MKKIIKIIVLTLALVALVFGGFYFYSGIKAIKNNDNKFLVNYRSIKQTQVAGVETNLAQPILTDSAQPSDSTSPKSTNKTSNSQQTSQTSQTTNQPSSPPSPTCNQSQKATLTNIYDTHVAEAARERDQIKNDALNQYLAELQAIEQRYKDVWDPFERDRLRARAREIAAGVLADARNMADRNYNGKVSALTSWLNAALRSINC